MSRKVVMGLSDRNMKAEVLRCFPRLTSVSDVVNQCEIIEVADKVAGRRVTGNVAALADAGASTHHPPQPPNSPATEVSAVNHQRRAWSRSAPGRAGPGRSRKRCKGCGDSGCGGTDKCPARDATCRNCGRKGHFWRMCRALTPGRGPATSNAVLVGGVEATADLSVRIVCPWPQAECCTTAVADTGAQVCIAGRPLLESLGIPPGQLHASPRTVSHVAGGGVKLLGSLTCEVTVGAITTSECVYIAEGVQRLYLSLGACRALQLVPQDFPRPAIRISALTAPASLKTSAHPLSPPYELVEENVGRLEKWLLEEFGRTVFATERTPLPEMRSPPHHIHLRPGACPHAVHVPATVPHHFYDEVRRQLDDDIARGIIEEVPAGEPTEWCARMVVVPKKNGKPRRTVDFQKLNQACLRETHHTRTPFDLISSVPKHTFKTVADAYSGYHQIPLDSESRKLTTFITPWGRFRYRRTPMGHCAAQDAFTKRLDDIMSDVPRKIKCVDDTLLHDESVAEAFWHTYGFLQKCRDNGVTLRPDKFSFCKRNVTFAGYLLGWEDYQPSHDLIKSITEFMMPASPSLTDIRSWFGLVNQVAPFLAVAPIMEPFRELLKKPAGKTVYWDNTLDAIFTSAKDTIKNLAAEGLKFYDTSRPTAVLTDYSRQGIGFIVSQQYCQCVSLEAPMCCPNGWKLVLCGSRHLTAAEKNYSTLEGEALAIAWCLKKARLFLLGCKNLTFITDHKALTKIFGDKELKDIQNLRILNIKEKTLMYNFRVKYIKGKTNCAADALSRYPALACAPEESDEADDEIVCAAMVAAAADATLDDVGRVVDLLCVEEEALRDEDYRLLHECVANNGWGEQKDSEPPSLRPYFRMRRHLSC
uniref:Reverse transcriptase n=1 Tax=Scylla olivacea TaxID=85551 RepID=A0A0P4VNI8_SCYOL